MNTRNLTVISVIAALLALAGIAVAAPVKIGVLSEPDLPKMGAPATRRIWLNC